MMKELEIEGEKVMELREGIRGEIKEKRRIEEEMKGM